MAKTVHSQRLARVLGIALGSAVASCAVTSSQSFPYREPVSGLACVAVLPFEASAGESVTGNVVAELVAGSLQLSDRYNIVEPPEVRVILDAQGLAYETPSSVDAARAYGQALGVDAVLTGAVERYVMGPGFGLRADDRAVAFSAQLLDVKSGQVLWRGNVAHETEPARLEPRPTVALAQDAVDVLMGELVEERPDVLASRGACAKRPSVLAAEYAKQHPGGLAMVAGGAAGSRALGGRAASGSGTTAGGTIAAGADRGDGLGWGGGAPGRDAGAGGSAGGLPPMPGDAGLPPLAGGTSPRGGARGSGRTGADSGLPDTGLPALPSDAGLPPLSGDSGLPAASRGGNGLSPMPGDDGGLPAMPGDDGGLPAMPGGDGGLPAMPGRDDGLPPMPGGDGGLPPMPGGDGGLPAMPDDGGLPPLGGGSALPALPDMGGPALPGLPDLSGPALPDLPDVGGGFPADPDEKGYSVASAAPVPAIKARLSARQRNLMRQLYAAAPQINRIFARNGTRMNAKARAMLNDVGALLRAVPTLKIVFEVHADLPGAAAKSQALADKQTAALEREIARRLPLAKGRVFCRSVGNRQPLAKDISNRARAQNNRVELRRVQ